MDTQNNDPKFSFIFQSEKNQKKFQIMEKFFFYLCIVAFIALFGSALYVTNSYQNLNLHPRTYQILPSFWWGILSFLTIGSFALKNICKEMSFISSMRASIKYDSIVKNEKTDTISLAKERYTNSRFYVAGYTSLFFASILISYSFAFHINYPLPSLNKSNLFYIISLLLITYVILVSMYRYFSYRLNSALGAAFAKYQQNKRNQNK